jgi:uncharacterized protein YdeI (YjbR/CyaY-like superfamily)
VQATYFERPAEFRAWLRRHHRTRRELWVGFYKKASGKPSITYPEALDEALCFGWIDGVRRALDAERYVQRFTPRAAHSFWSAVNTRKAKALISAGRMQPAGLAAFRARDRKRTAEYSFERARRLDAAQLRAFRAHRDAWTFFEALPPGLKRTSIWYVISAKRDDTKAKRLAQLIACSARGERLPGLPPTPGTRR